MHITTRKLKICEVGLKSVGQGNKQAGNRGRICCSIWGKNSLSLENLDCSEGPELIGWGSLYFQDTYLKSSSKGDLKIT